MAKKQTKEDMIEIFIDEIVGCFGTDGSYHHGQLRTKLNNFINDNFVANSELKEAINEEILSEKTPIADSIVDWLINGKKDD